MTAPAVVAAQHHAQLSRIPTHVQPLEVVLSYRFLFRPFHGVMLLLLALAWMPAAAEEPFLVADLNTVALGSDPGPFVELADTVYFAASSALTGRELWASDGTPEGTVLVRDAVPGAFSGMLEGPWRVNDRLFFAGSHQNRRLSEPWVSDGTTAGTRPLAAEPGTLGLAVSAVVPTGEVLFYVAQRHSEVLVWRTDGSTAGSYPLEATVQRDARFPEQLVAAGDWLFYTAPQTDAPDPVVLWSVHTTGGPAQPMPKIVRPFAVVPLPGNRVLAPTPRPDFDKSVGKIWVADGRSDEAGPVVDLSQLPGRRRLVFVQPAKSRVFIGLHRVTTETLELWLSDGTPGGTRHYSTLEFDLETDREVHGTVALGDDLVLAVRAGGVGVEAWISDGTDAGTRLLGDLAPGSAGSSPAGFTPWQDELVFTAWTPSTGRELWRTDGTPEGTHLVTDAVAGAAGAAPRRLLVVGDTVWAGVQADGLGREPWVIPIVGGPARQVADVNRDGTAGANPFPVATLGPRLLFGVGSDPERRLWTSDGSAAETRPVTGSPRLARFDAAAAAGWVLFSGSDAATGAEPWVTDGRRALPLGDLMPGAGGSDPSGPAELDGAAVFTATDPAGLGLWRWHPGARAGQGEGARTKGRPPVSGRPLVLSGDGHLERIATVGPPVAGLGRTPVAVGDAVFVPVQGLNGEPTRLWVSDGTSAGTVPVLEAAGSTGVLEAVAVGDHLVFTLPTGDGDIELWASDGTMAGTAALPTGQPVPVGPTRLTASGSEAYFAAVDESQTLACRVLWRADPALQRIEKVSARCANQLADVGGSLAFAGGWPNRQLSVVSTAGVTTVAEVDPGFTGFRMTDFSVHQAELVFVLELDPRFWDVQDEPSQLWASDLTPTGTRVLADVAAGRPGGRETVTFVAPAADLVFFGATDGVHGRELWAVAP